VPGATAAAVAAGDSKQREADREATVKERDTIRKHDEREGPDKKPSLKVKRALCFQSPCNFTTS
jgi:hypothetical protein